MMLLNGTRPGNASYHILGCNLLIVLVEEKQFEGLQLNACIWIHQYPTTSGHASLAQIRCRTNAAVCLQIQLAIQILRLYMASLAPKDDGLECCFYSLRHQLFSGRHSLEGCGDFYILQLAFPHYVHGVGNGSCSPLMEYTLTATLTRVANRWKTQQGHKAVVAMVATRGVHNATFLN
jgi:hypothetical protein